MVTVAEKIASFPKERQERIEAEAAQMLAEHDRQQAAEQSASRSEVKERTLPSPSLSQPALAGGSTFELDAQTVHSDGSPCRRNAVESGLR